MVKKRNKRKTLENGLDKYSRLVALKQAGYRCAKCGRLMEKGLNVHHVFSRYNRATRWMLDNLICLCPVHHSIGTNSAHNSPAEFIEWFKNKYGNRYNKILKASSVSKKWTIKEMEEYLQELKEML